MKLAITGAKGFVGTKITPILSKNYEIIPIGQEEGVDILEENSLEKAIYKSGADYILHLAAFTNVDEAEKQKQDGENSMVWKVNVKGAENVAKYAQKNNIKLIHVSTDVVFGKNNKDWFHENDKPESVNFYGLTKLEGEKKVIEQSEKPAILRIAYPYTWDSQKLDFVRIFIKLFKENKPFNSINDAFFAPTYIDDIAMVIKTIIDNKLTGFIHGASQEKLCGYEIALKVAERFRLNKSLVSPIGKDEFYKNRAARSNNTALFNDTLDKLGIKMTNLNEALQFTTEDLYNNI